VNTTEVTLCNTSEVLMTYRLRVPSDGSKNTPQDSNSNNKSSNTTTAAPVAVLVKEFAIRPRSGTIPPNLSQDIQVLSTYVAVSYPCTCLCMCVSLYSLCICT